MHNPAAVLENDTHKLRWDFDIQTDHLILTRRPDLIIINKKKRICKIVDFAVLADHRIKLKECKKKDKYYDLARELKKLWNMKGTIVPIMTVPRDWRTWRLEDESRPSKLQHYWEWPEYWEDSWRLEETCCHSGSSERPSANADVKNSQGVNNNNNNKEYSLVIKREKEREGIEYQNIVGLSH